MTIFLTHLTNIALGRAAGPVARPALPPRFVEAGASETLSTGFDAIAPRKSVVNEVDVLRHAVRARPFPIDTTGFVNTVTPDTEPAGRPASYPAEPSRLPRNRQTASVQKAETHRSPNRSAPVRDVFTPKFMSATAPVQFASPMANVSLPPHRTQPLNPVVVASMRVPRQEAPPIIEVTIDRIDIRAPAADKPTAQSPRKRRDPALALGDYLRGQETAP
jgi:hypothetical protein